MAELPMQEREALAGTLLPLRIIVAALALGTLVFMVVVLAIGPIQDIPEEEGVPLVTYIALSFLAVILVMRVVVRGVAVAQGRRTIVNGDFRLAPGGGLQAADGQASAVHPDVQALAQLFRVRLIVGVAMLEGAAFFLLVAYLMEQSPLSLIAVAPLIVAIVLHWPTTSGIIHWIEDQQTLLGQERQLAGH